MSTEETIARCIGTLTALFPAFSRKLSEQEIDNMITAYHAVLQDIPDQLLNAATLHAAGKGRFFPSASELRQAAVEIKIRAEDIPPAQDAWGEVKRAFRSGFSRYNVPSVADWSHPMIARALDAIGGWRTLCDSENDAADRARFLQAYQVYLERNISDLELLPAVSRAVEQIRGRRGISPMPLSDIIREMIPDQQAGQLEAPYIEPATEMAYES